MLTPRQSQLCKKEDPFTPERNADTNAEVDKLLKADTVKEVLYPTWLSNPVMVKKPDESWRMCIDYKNLNKACPKDCVCEILKPSFPVV